MKRDKVVLSIILPCFNVEKFVGKVYQSIILQNVRSWEAIFVDDGSNDHTFEKLEKIKKRDERVKIIKQENAGSGPARNKGVELAVGKYLYFMDPDDEFLGENSLKILLGAAESNNAEIVISGYKEFDLVNKKEKKFGPNSFLTTKTNDEVKRNYFFIVENNIFNPPWNKLFLKEFWNENKLEFPAVKKGQDALLNLVAFKFLNRLTMIPNYIYAYYIGREGSAQTMLSDNDLEYFRINQQYEKELLEHWDIKNEHYFIEKKISFYFADSVKVYRYIKSRSEGIKEFVELWNSRKAKKEIENITLLDIKMKEKSLIKLFSMKHPFLNYCIQKQISK
ncbi:glycosyltransferase family 2 protein [Tetragenococcus halophilus]|uniref:glycosyltransferase family 2 protein n=1 Tax=Tetragenococcus halophilus TaxID=51669 RepID=UPI002A99A55D|nr:hypothetical protein TEHSL10_04050 [Tetragenococcus halophilus]